MISIDVDEEEEKRDRSWQKRMDFPLCMICVVAFLPWFIYIGVKLTADGSHQNHLV